MEDGKSTWVKTLTLSPPSLDNNRADSERLSDSLKILLKTEFLEIGLYLLRKIPACLRKWNYRVQCVLFRDGVKWILTGILDPASPEKPFGIAVDLGTTRIALNVCELETGKDLHESSFDNPQINISADVLTRIHFASSYDGLCEVNKLIIDGLNNMIALSCRLSGIETDNIYLVSVAGNTAMVHFFLKLNPQWISREPYIPATNRPGTFRSIELGIKVNPSATIFVFPNIGSYFGGDLIAGILYSGINRSEKVSILVDVGTNAEVAIGNMEWLIGCAGAAGPALESGAAKMGMYAGPGAIDRVRISSSPEKIDIHTIDDKKAVGICGSGLIDLLAHLFLSGMIDTRGKFVKEKCGHCLKKVDDVDCFVLVPGRALSAGKEITVNQKDLDSLIRSKAAMYAILRTITGTVGMAPEEMDTFYVGGTFGSFIDTKSAISIGMFPDLPLARYKQLGNCSLGGASMVLRSESFLNDVDNIRDSITYLELNVNQEFMNNFSGAKFLPHTDYSLFPSVKRFET